MSDKPKRARTKETRIHNHPHFRNGSMLNRPLRLPRRVELVAAVTQTRRREGKKLCLLLVLIGPEAEFLRSTTQAGSSAPSSSSPPHV